MHLLFPEKHDNLRASEHRNLSAATPFRRAPRVLSKGAPAANLPSPNGEVSFRWLNAGLATENAAFDDSASHVGSGREPAIGLAMVFVEAASTRPSHKSLKGWESIKLGMDYVLGRSIVPETKHKISQASHSACKDVLSRKTISLQRYSLTSRNGLDPPLTCKETNCHPQIQHSLHLASAEELKGTPKQFLFFERNAVAGAVSGMCVSLCLHPIDTVKTVIQSQSIGNRSVFRTLLAIISKRGVFGLYRGLGSNLASSAPISALYTFTYESVKAALLPHLPKEYHAIAHCTAGGCASVATSIIYTPSECVKQQMQVGSLYRNSWLTFLGILKNGGLSVLYSGWVAVLCRNVPQSVIKFYTYEGLKHYVLSEKRDGTPLSAYQTLAFGGLAGCTAALFTTPFDVIKTRLQTQLPGSVLYRKGVLQVFQHIATSEGVGGLYRGLLPRLVIYLSQGAIFFATYEFMRRLLEMDIPKLTVLACHSKEMASQGKGVKPAEQC